MICEHFECIQYCQSCFPYSNDLSYKRINDYKFPKTMESYRNTWKQFSYYYLVKWLTVLFNCTLLYL